MHTPSLFETSEFSGRVLAAVDIPRLQALFEANPGSLRAINGHLPAPDEARSEFDSFPPAHLSFAKRWFAGLFDRHGELIGAAVVVSDLAAAGVWHIGLFLIASPWQGRGIGTGIFLAMEQWMRGSGAMWLRLGVLDENVRAQRFWSKRGFTQVRVRPQPNAGDAGATVRVLVKALGSATLEEYLARVPRDQPDSPLP